MSDFEREVLGYIPQVQDKTVLEEAARQERLRESETRQAAKEAERERLRLVGKQGADLLLSHGIPTIPIMKKPKEPNSLIANNGRGVIDAMNPGLPVRIPEHVADGWHVFRGVKVTDIDMQRVEYLYNFSLRTDGMLEQFAPRVDSKRFQQVSEPYPVGNELVDKLLTSEGYKKALAGLIGGLGIQDVYYSHY